MNDNLKAVVTVHDCEPSMFTIFPGDVIDLGPCGRIKWLPPDLSEADRIVDRVHQERVQAAINYVTGKQESKLKVAISEACAALAGCKAAFGDVANISHALNLLEELR